MNMSGISSGQPDAATIQQLGTMFPFDPLGIVGQMEALSQQQVHYTYFIFIIINDKIIDLLVIKLLPGHGYIRNSKKHICCKGARVAQW